MRQDVGGKTEQLVKELKHLYDERLVSVCVYGSAVFEDDLPAIKDKHKNINVLVILKGLEPADLEKASSIGKWWEKVGHSLPIFMSEEEWRRSADVFALEYADIKDNHVVVFGQDLYNETQIQPDALRLICELELHRKLIFLRQRLLLYRDKPQILLSLLQDSNNSFAALFRAVIRLRQNGAAPLKPHAVFEGLKSIVPGFDDAPFQSILRSKESKSHVALTDVFALFNRYIKQVSLVTAFVDECYGFIEKKEGVYQ